MRRANTIQTRILIIAIITLVAVLVAPFLSGQAEDVLPAKPTTKLIAEGEGIYTNICIACHQADGNGVPGAYPALNRNPKLTTYDPTFFVSTVLTGRGGMPTFASILSNEEIAAVVSYVRQAWDNDAAPIRPEAVAAIRPIAMGTPEASPPPPGQRPAGIAPPDSESAVPEQ